MNYRSIADMNRTVTMNIYRLPRNIEMVVGVPRSGLLAATLISLVLNIRMADLDSFLDGRVFSAGRTKRVKSVGRNGRPSVLIVDDSINGGTAMALARRKIENSSIEADFVYAAIYGSKPSYPGVDIVFELVPAPRMFQWNFMHHVYLENACVDIDGVLCLDPTEAENDDGVAYKAFLADARPLFLPTRRIRWLVTSRLEKYRTETATWLAANGVEYDELVMLNLRTKEERQALSAHGAFKANFYRRCNAVIFIESDDTQAAEIARLAGKPVLSLASHQVYQPSGGLFSRATLKRVTTAKDRNAVLKPMIRNAIGERGYEMLKKIAQVQRLR